MNVLCHKPFDLCYKDTANERNNKIKIKVFIKAVDNFVENPVDNYLLIHQSADGEAELWISTVLSHQFMKVFHYFYRKKDINLLTLHRKQELWISHVTC